MGRPRKTALRLPAPEVEEFEDDTPELPPVIETDEDRADMDLEISAHMPLFGDADKPESRTPAAITVHQITTTGKEYRGKLPPSATEETIYQAFGNGTYDLTLVDENTRYLRKKHGIRINMTTPRENDASNGNGHAPGIDAASIRDILREERQRSLELLAAERSALALRAEKDEHRNDSFLAMIMESRKAEAEQMRMFFAANERAAQESFKQILGIMSTGHTMQMQAMQANTGKPNEMIQALMLGMQLAQGIDPEAEEKPSMIEQMIAGMVPMIGGLTAKAASPAAAPKKKLSNGVPAPRQMAAPAPQPNPAPAPLVTAAPAPAPELAPPKKKGALSPEEIEEIKALKILTAKRGISMADVIKQGRAYLETVGGAAAEDEEEEDFEDPDEPELDEEGNPVSPSEEESPEGSEDPEEEDLDSDDEDDETDDEDDRDADSESDEGTDDET